MVTIKVGSLIKMINKLSSRDSNGEQSEDINILNSGILLTVLEIKQLTRAEQRKIKNVNSTPIIMKVADKDGHIFWLAECLEESVFKTTKTYIVVSQ